MESKITCGAITLLIIFGMLPAVLAGEKEIQTQITNATVFTRGAQVFRKATTDLIHGKTTIVLTGLSPYIDKQTIRVTGYGDFTILSVNHRANHLKKPRNTEKIEALKKRIEVLNQNISEEKTWIKVLAEREEFLKSNFQMSGKNQAIQPEDFKTMDAYFAEKMESIRFSIMEKGHKVQGYSEEINIINAQLKDLNVTETTSFGEILIQVESEKTTTAEFEINYMVGNAGWYPSYDLRVVDISQPVQLDYKANVFQNTGVDWENVVLKFSNVSPDQNAVAPELYPWYLNFYQSESDYNSSNNKTRISDDYAGYQTDPSIREVSGIVTDKETAEPIPFANVMVTGTTIGTTSDFDGRFSLSIPQHAKSITCSFVGYETLVIPIYNREIHARMQVSVMALETVMVVEYKVPLIGGAKDKKKEARNVKHETIRQETFFEFELKSPFTLKRTSKPTIIKMHTISMDATYEYVSAPKIEQKAFLSALIPGWEKYDLISGEAGLYFEHTFIGKSLIDISQLSDTLAVSMGEDRNIFIQREKIKDFYKWQTVGSNVVETFAWEITARNTKDVEVGIIIRDQVPVSQNRDISVDVMEVSGGKLNEETGIVEWKIKLQPGETHEIPLSYSVKYPKGVDVRLD